MAVVFFMAACVNRIDLSQRGEKMWDRFLVRRLRTH
jgi:hypothetical protein